MFCQWWTVVFICFTYVSWVLFIALIFLLQIFIIIMSTILFQLLSCSYLNHEFSCFYPSTSVPPSRCGGVSEGLCGATCWLGLNHGTFLPSLQKARCEERVITEERFGPMYPSVLQKHRLMVWGLSLSGWFVL